MNDCWLIKNQRNLIDCLHLFVLAQFAFTQPLLYRLSRKTVYLEDQSIEFEAILLVMILLSVVVPGVLWLFEVGVGLISDRARERAHESILFILLTLIAMPILKLAVFLPGMLLMALAPAVSVLAVLAYRRWDWARTLVSAAALALIVFPGQFLWFSPVSRYLFPRRVEEHWNAANNPVPVVVLLFDEFCGISLMDRDGRIDRVRYPHFAALAETATWYRNATSVHPRTEMAVPAILTGNYPSGPRPATIAEYPVNLFSLLDSTGQYEFIVFEPYTRLCRPRQVEREPVSRARMEQAVELVSTLRYVYLSHLFPLDTPFEVPDTPSQWYAARPKPSERPNTRTGVFRYNWNADRDLQFDEFLRRIEPPDQPTLYFAHLAIPHIPWCFLPSGKRYTPDDAHQSVSQEHWVNDELAVVQAYQRYLFQVGYVDRLLGNLMERLHAVDLFDRCLLIVLADHGVSFRAGRSRRLPVQETLSDIASIPLLIKLPQQQAGATSDRNVESIDVLPTLLDVLDLNEQPKSDGVSLLDSLVQERKQKRILDEVQTFTLPAAFPSKQEVLERMIDLFGDGSDPDRLWAPQIGPHTELIGQSIDELALGAPSKIELTLREPILDAIANDATYLPCYFSGFVSGHDVGKHPVNLAISINGIVRAVTRTYTDKTSSHMWSAMVPPTAFQPAVDNISRIFVVTSTGDQVTLHPVLDDMKLAPWGR